MESSELVASAPLIAGSELPLVVTPTNPDVDLLAWSATAHQWVRDKLHRHGALLFRGFSQVDRTVFAEFVANVSAGALPYTERSSPRSAVGRNIYTSTEQPADQTIFLHNEHSYSLNWPMRLFFFCETAPAEGGATPLADTRRIYRRISEQTRQRFAERDYAYVRNIRSGLGLDWTEVYQTDDRAEVEEYCRQNDIALAWQPDGGLSTKQVRPLIRRHPATAEDVWFNHMLFFNFATLSDEVRIPLSQGATTGLPNNTYYGDGAEIEPEVLAEIRAAYEAETVRFPWQEGDVLMFDNMLVSHARDSFTPPRKILVAMAEPYQTFSSRTDR